MKMAIYEKPMEIILDDSTLFVDGQEREKAVRKVKELKPVLATKYPEDLVDTDVYYMYREVCKKNNIRFDITVIPANPIADECPKTHGHYHPKSEDGMAYPEVYQVLHGKALFMLQKKKRDRGVDVLMVDATKGEVVMIPPGYGHNTINSGSETLVLSNLVYDPIAPMYDEYKRNKGSAYYYMADGSIVQNTNYIIDKNERIGASALNKRYKFESKDLLTEFMENPEKFVFLEKPGKMFRK
ncbi:glucose-6-phosphate isomerase [Candidatus Micrarchaeota archaeon]|nr:glucose-6-phosphate isomerase [Candidatus Micrarchaeota archaeon]MBU1165355.1 glucose-6-phosphate isomerase [Candidatus Micrarchaeota archaeon]MBU1886479.1 glucose-6-phosphate isomerase [Candidatus Micrarchaeota archaeon]